MIKDIVPLLIIAALLLVIVYALFFAPTITIGLHYPVEGGQETCTEGQTQSCRVGACTGISTCTGGSWGGCKWKTVCTPGTKAPCTLQGCAYAYKECNECGTGYGPCVSQE